MNAVLKKAIVPTGCLLVGSLLTVGTIKLNPELIEKKFEKPKVVKHYIDPFERMENHMKHVFNQFPAMDIDEDYLSDIDQREDDNFVYYDLKGDDLDSAPINTNVQDGHITISGTVEKKEDESFYKSSFSRTFPLPLGVNGNQVEVVPDKNKVTLKFPKIKV